MDSYTRNSDIQQEKKSYFLTIQSPVIDLIEVETNAMKFLNYTYKVLTLKKRP